MYRKEKNKYIKTRCVIGNKRRTRLKKKPKKK